MVRNSVLLCLVLLLCGCGGGLQRGADRSVQAEPIANPATRLLPPAGEPHRLYVLGEQYEMGSGGFQKDLVKAKELYERSATLGNADAQLHLGMLYECGRCGLSRDGALAAQWYGKAAEQGNAEAMSRLSGLYQVGDGVPKDPEQALLWKKRAAEAGEVWSQISLGRQYQFGRDVPSDFKSAVYWFEKAAAQGNVTALFELGELYYFQKDLPGSDEKAIAYYRQAAELGSVSAEEMLGGYYAFREKADAAYWYHRAARHGNIESIRALAFFYGEGYLVDYNPVLSYAYYMIVDWHFRIPEIAARISRMAAELTPAQIEEGKHLAEEWEKMFWATDPQTDMDLPLPTKTMSWPKP